MGIFTGPKANQVFTPGDLPLNKSNVYVSRAVSEEKLRRGLERNWCPIVHGDYGVGKTTMVRRYFHAEERRDLYARWVLKAPRRGRVVYFASADGLTMPKVFEAVLDHLEYRVEIERTSTRASDTAAGFSDSSIAISATRSRARSVTERLVVTAPTDESLLRIIDGARLTIIIDELHRASDAFRADLVPFIKASRISAARSNLVLIGTAADALTLVSSDPGIDRYVADTPVKTMSEAEARLLITDGFKKLAITIPEEIVVRTIQAAAGAPATVQALCLDMAENAGSERRRVIGEADLTYAVKHFIQDRHGRMTRRYIAAIETHGEKRYRKRILHAIASLEGDYATMEDIRASVSVQLGEDVQAGAISGPLRDLKKAEFGSILQDVNRDSGGRIQNVTSFADPMMKSYVRFMDTITSTHLVHEDEVREALAPQA